MHSNPEDCPNYYDGCHCVEVEARALGHKEGMKQAAEIARKWKLFESNTPENKRLIQSISESIAKAIEDDDGRHLPVSQ